MTLARSNTLTPQGNSFHNETDITQHNNGNASVFRDASVQHRSHGTAQTDLQQSTQSSSGGAQSGSLVRRRAMTSLLFQEPVFPVRAAVRPDREDDNDDARSGSAVRDDQRDRAHRRSRSNDHARGSRGSNGDQDARSARDAQHDGERRGECSRRNASADRERGGDCENVNDRKLRHTRQQRARQSRASDSNQSADDQMQPRRSRRLNAQERKAAQEVAKIEEDLERHAIMFNDDIVETIDDEDYDDQERITWDDDFDLTSDGDDDDSYRSSSHLSSRASSRSSRSGSSARSRRFAGDDADDSDDADNASDQHNHRAMSDDEHGVDDDGDNDVNVPIDADADADCDSSHDQRQSRTTRRRRRRRSQDSQRSDGATDDADLDDQHTGRGSERRDPSRRAAANNADSIDHVDSADIEQEDSNTADSESSDASDGQLMRRRRRTRTRDRAQSRDHSDRARARSRDANGDDDGSTSRPARSRKQQYIDEITDISGSTRLEAKRQRRRDNRRDRHRQNLLIEQEFLARRENVDRQMIVRERGQHTQISVVEDNVLVEHYVSDIQEVSCVGNIYLGRVQNVLPSMEAAFVDIGLMRNGVLYAGEVNWDAARLEGQPRLIEAAFKPGDPVLVQVTKDPIGHKGARLTSQVTLAGRFLVLVPSGAITGVSRKLSERERSRLKAIVSESAPKDMGVIIRTAAEGAPAEAILKDLQGLIDQWDHISKKREEYLHGKRPKLLLGEPDMAIRVVRDIFNDDFNAMLVEGQEVHGRINEYLASMAPDLCEKIEYWDVEEHHGKDVFDRWQIDSQLRKSMERQVYLPSGGSIVIDRTEAMTTIDVNTGRFIGKGKSLEETVTRCNLEAAEEIVRQLRVRDIGGMVMIDFVDMVLPANRDLVLRRLVECLSRDRTKHQVAEVTSLGLVQMTRKRIGQGLVEAFSEECPTCKGRGFIVHDDPTINADLADPYALKGGDPFVKTNKHGRGTSVASSSSSDPAPASSSADVRAKLAMIAAAAVAANESEVGRNAEHGDQGVHDEHDKFADRAEHVDSAERDEHAKRVDSAEHGDTSSTDDRGETRDHGEAGKPRESAHQRELSHHRESANQSVASIGDVDKAEDAADASDMEDSEHSRGSASHGAVTCGSVSRDAASRSAASRGSASRSASDDDSSTSSSIASDGHSSELALDTSSDDSSNSSHNTAADDLTNSSNSAHSHDSDSEANVDKSSASGRTQRSSKRDTNNNPRNHRKDVRRARNGKSKPANSSDNNSGGNSQVGSLAVSPHDDTSAGNQPANAQPETPVGSQAAPSQADKQHAGNAQFGNRQESKHQSGKPDGHIPSGQPQDIKLQIDQLAGKPQSDKAEGNSRIGNLVVKSQANQPAVDLAGGQASKPQSHDSQPAA